MYLSIYLSIHPSIYLSTCLSASLKTQLFCETSSGFELDNIKNAAILRDSLYVWTWQRQKRSNSARLPHFFCWQHQKRSNSARLSQCLNLTTSKYEAILRDFFIFQSWRHQKRSNSPRFPQFLNLTTWNNSARLLHFPNLTTSITKQFCETSSILDVDNIKNQKRYNSARLPSKMESWVQRPRTNAFCNFCTPPV